MLDTLRSADRLARNGGDASPIVQRVQIRGIGGHLLDGQLDRELRVFKADVRKLKGMGLTTSFEVGYELTALGRRVLDSL